MNDPTKPNSVRSWDTVIGNPSDSPITDCSMKNYEPLEQLLVQSVTQVGRYLRDHAFDYGTLEWKHHDDPVTALDKHAERTLRELIQARMPANFNGEEYGLEDHGADYTFILDPIDGTKSFIRHDFNSSVSVGVEEKGELIGGLVYDFMRDLLYVGFRGRTYTLFQGQEKPFAITQKFSKLHLLVDVEGTPLLEELARQPKISAIKRVGSLALAMAQVAAGTHEGLIAYARGKGNIWSSAAGYYLLKSAGCEVIDMHGKPYDYRNELDGIVALHKDIALHIKPFLPSSKGMRSTPLRPYSDRDLESSDSPGPEAPTI